MVGSDHQAVVIRSTCTVRRRGVIERWRDGIGTARRGGELSSDDGDRPVGCRGGSPARLLLLLPLLRVSFCCCCRLGRVTYSMYVTIQVITCGAARAFVLVQSPLLLCSCDTLVT